MTTVFAKVNSLKIEWFLASLAVGSLLIALLSPFKIMAVLFAAFSVALAFTRPRLLLLCVGALVAVEPFALKWIPDELYIEARYFSELMIYVLMVSAMFHALAGKARPFMQPLFVCMIAILLTALISALVNSTPLSVAILGTRQILRFLLLGWLVYFFDDTGKFARQFLILILSLVALESVVAIAQSLIGAPMDDFLIASGAKFAGDIQLTAGTHQFWESGQRVFATMGRYDQLGIFLTFGLLLAAGVLYEIGKAKNQDTPNALPITRNQLVVLFLVGIPALVLTYSRASWFGFLLGLFCLGVLIKKDMRILSGFIAGAIAFILYLFFSWALVANLTDTPSQSVLTRFSEAFSYERWRGEYYGLGRLYYIVHTPLNVVSHAPLFGVGPGSYGGGAAAALHHVSAYEKSDIPFGIYGTEGYIDNNWFSIWGELGTLGLALYIALFVLLARAALSLHRVSNDPLTRGIALGFFGCILALSFQAFLGTYLEVRTIAFYFWLFAGLIISQEARLTQSVPEQKVIEEEYLKKVALFSS